MMVFSGFLHQHSQGKKLVSTALALTETALAFPEELFCSGLEAIQDGFGKHLTGYTQKSDITVVVTVRLPFLCRGTRI